MQHSGRSPPLPERQQSDGLSGKSTQAPCRALIEAWSANAHKNAKAVAKESSMAFGHLSPDQVTPLMVHAMYATWRKRLSTNTVLAYRTQLKKLLSLLNIQADLPKARRHQRATVATPDELARILQQPKASLRLFLLLYFQCGLRRAETLRVTPRSWNPEEHTVTIQVKGGETRTATITPDVEALFISAGNPGQDTPFIHALNGKPITAAGINRAWQTHKKRAGVRPEVTTHDLRRTAATIVYTATKDLRAAQQLLGHKSLASTLGYLAPLHPEEARRYAELLRFEHFKSEVKQ